jgi:hypothetical protein
MRRRRTRNGGRRAMGGCCVFPACPESETRSAESPVRGSCCADAMVVAALSSAFKRWRLALPPFRYSAVRCELRQECPARPHRLRSTVPRSLTGRKAMPDSSAMLNRCGATSGPTTIGFAENRVADGSPRNTVGWRFRVPLIRPSSDRAIRRPLGRASGLYMRTSFASRSLHWLEERFPGFR